MINASSPSEMSRQSSERQTEASTPFPQDVANQVNIVIVVLITDESVMMVMLMLTMMVMLMVTIANHIVSTRCCKPGEYCQSDHEQS